MVNDSDSSNNVTFMETDYYHRACRSVDVILVTSGMRSKLIYHYNYEGTDYYLFDNICALIDFFQGCDSSVFDSGSEQEIDDFLASYKWD